MKKEYCYIEWFDPVSDDVWRPYEEVKDNPNTIKSIGWIVKETPSCIVLGLNSDEAEESWSLTMTIPKVLIKGDVQRFEFTRDQTEFILE